MGEAHRGDGRGRLYVVATPIGHLADITLRALEVLRSVDLVLAEDTRATGHLLTHHGIRTPLRSLHQHNEAVGARVAVDALAAGQSVALVSEAGTPGISDPGAVAVAAVRDAGFDVVPVPGASAVVAAVSVSGFAGPFAFVGFLPPKQAARRRALEGWRAFPHSLVIYEAPHRVRESVTDLVAVLGGARRLVIARELTKMFETIHACRLDEADAWLAADPNRTRGELVLVVEGAPEPTGELSSEDERLIAALAAELPVKQAVKLAADIAGGRKNAFYARALQLRGASAGPADDASRTAEGDG
jgi:16S rRNA (cytidine1402-2'-O)-methyltransferase